MRITVGSETKVISDILIGKDEISVSHASIQSPTEARYFWAGNIEGNVRLYNSANLPTSIFTTAK